MKTTFTTLLGAFAFFTVTAAALAADTPPDANIGTTQKGPTLTDTRGMTLYTFDKDTDGKSVCMGPCADNWPPLDAAETAQANDDWTRVYRNEGTSQWAYHGKPLYRWKKDVKPGDITGDGLLNNSWHVAQP